MPLIAAAGTTILLVEQNIEQALAASSSVYCLLEGRISLAGRTVELSREAIVTAYFGI
jgi:branched-chain amino acid transport system ATP-binding protein